MIEGVQVLPLQQIKDERGMVMRWLRKDAPHFLGFGEIYFSQVNEGVIKAWKLHKERTQHLVVPHGLVKFALYDPRSDSKTFKEIQEIEIGKDKFNLLIIPPGIWYGFKGLNPEFALIGNCTDEPFQEGETERLDLVNDLVPYEW